MLWNRLKSYRRFGNYQWVGKSPICHPGEGRDPYDARPGGAGSLWTKSALMIVFADSTPPIDRMDPGFRRDEGIVNDGRCF
jgi:hypothetical protein